MRVTGLLFCLAVIVLAAGCGNQVVPTPQDSTDNYVNVLAEGNFASACGLLAPSARTAVERSDPRAPDCAALLRRCLPNSIIALAKDPLQLLYANHTVTISGRRATVVLSGTAASGAIRRVTLIHEHGKWLLTTPGRAISRCLARLSRPARPRHRGHSHG